MSEGWELSTVQNPLLNEKDFIKQCELRDIRVEGSELDFLITEKLLDNFGTKKDKLFSIFQIFWIQELLPALSINIIKMGSTLSVSSMKGVDAGKGTFEIKSLDELQDRLKDMADNSIFKDYFNANDKLIHLQKEHVAFHKRLTFLRSIEDVYYPNFKSGGGTITVTGDMVGWSRLRKSFQSEKVLQSSDITIDDVASFYKDATRMASRHLGSIDSDWAMLWLNISWSKKERLSGAVRIGTDYLQLARMLKQFIEDHLGMEILDVDEIKSIGAESITTIDPLTISTAMSMRTYRNEYYTDPDGTSYYHDKPKRLYWLANEFGLSYQPRLHVLVEGATEERSFYQLFEWYTGLKPSSIGVEFRSISGVNNLMGELNYNLKKNQKAFYNNFSHLLSYNLNKWQTIPFVVIDDEGGVSDQLFNGISIHVDGESYKMPNEWKEVWAGNSKYGGNNFEMCNFSNYEIANAMSSILSADISSDSIEERRNKDEGIKKVALMTGHQKLEIAHYLCQNIVDTYALNQDPEVLNRPMFKLFDRLRTLATLNHAPMNRIQELRNRDIIVKTLTNNESAMRK